MKKIFNWLNEHASPTESENQPADSVLVEDVVMPDIYAEDYEPTVPDLKTIDLRASGSAESEGFDPYDTVRMHKK